jgi:hypothetical protein
MFSRWQFARYGLMVVYAVLACIGVGADLYAARDWGGIAALALGVILFEVVISSGLDDGLKRMCTERPVLGGLMVAGALALSPLPAFVCHAGVEAGLTALEHSKRESFSTAKSEKLQALNEELGRLKTTLARAQNAAAAEAAAVRGPQAKASVGSNFETIYGADLHRQTELLDLIATEQNTTLASAYPPAITWLLAVVLEVVKFYVAFGIMCCDLNTRTAKGQLDAPSREPGQGGLRSAAFKWMSGVAMGAMAFAPSAAAEAASIQPADHARPSVERAVDRPERSSPPVKEASPAHRNAAQPPAAGKRRRRDKVDAAMLAEVRHALSGGATYRALQARFGVAKSTLCDAVHRAEREMI